MVLFFGQQQIFIQLRCVTHLYCKPLSVYSQILYLFSIHEKVTHIHTILWIYARYCFNRLLQCKQKQNYLYSAVDHHKWSYFSAQYCERG